MRFIIPRFAPPCFVAAGLLLLCLFYSGWWSAICYAQGALSASEQISSVTELPETVVTDRLDHVGIGAAAIPEAGRSVLDRQQIDMLPQGDGNVTDLLRILPGVQFGEGDNLSSSGGEILPAQISISGGRVYENNFLLDGLGNNNILDPLYDRPESVIDVPGHSQELFPDLSIVDEISVYRSNVPARYSGFTGGVIEVQTRDPAAKFGAKLSARSTRSEWSSFHVDRADREGFYASQDAKQQPEFRKYHHGINLDLPLSERFGILLSYTHQYSRIPLHNFGTIQHQYRKQENIFVKALFKPTDATRLGMTFLSTPYSAQYFRAEVKDSTYTLRGGGWSIATKLEHAFASADTELSLGYRSGKNERSAPAEYFSYQVSPTANWGERFSRKGGYGDLETGQDTLTLATHAEFHPFTWGALKQQWNVGTELERTNADYRHAGTVNSGWKLDDGVQCEFPDQYCLPQEQYAYSRVVYPADKVDAEISFTDIYVEDTLSWWRLKLRAGVHFGYNDFTRNEDYAGRSVLSYDLLGDETTVLSVGANRYYGKTFLAHALEQEKSLSSSWQRSLNADGTPGEWEETKRKTYPQTRVSDLNTPYSDEWSMALEQKIPAGMLTLSYVKRDSEEQLAKQVLSKDEHGYVYSEWNNNGQSSHEEVSLTWTQRWDIHFLHLNATWQDSEASNESYTDILDFEKMEELVYYHGKLTPWINLPRSDYNREWSANLIYHVQLGSGFGFTNTTSYRSGYTAILDTKEKYKSEAGESFAVYAEVSRPSATTFDWKLTWEHAIGNLGTLALTAEVYNVFNRKLYTGTTGEYKMGRQLWVGLDYTF
ncbi:MAG: TonB-dependent receptor plug domain-containing protein [Desulfuromonadaceae bacterium]|nr:TonB-dependent receptor plug domain-containing protein [Desulfuromonadaceae bacterium]